MKHVALLLIDIQQGFDDLAYWGGNRNNASAENNASTLLAAWRAQSLPVVHVKHNSTNPKSRLAPGQPGNEIRNEVKPLATELVIGKNVNSAFIGTDLDATLKKMSVTTLVLVGLTTDHCVSTTARMAANLGFETYVVSDATATFDRVSVSGEKFNAQLMHETALASLNGEFATVLTTKEILNKIHEHAPANR
nr:Isochorismatase family [uncultured bacterium]